MKRNMTIQEAAIWSKDNEAFVSSVEFSGPSNIKLIMHHDYFRSEIGGGAVHISNAGLQATDWREWRKYFTFLEAMSLMMDESNVLKYDMPLLNDKEFYGRDGMPRVKVGSMEFAAKFDTAHHLKKWYIKTPTDPENDSTDESDEPVFDLTYEEAKKIGMYGGTVSNEDMEEGRYLKMHNGYWVNIEDQVLAKSINEFSSKKWREVIK